MKNPDNPGKYQAILSEKTPPVFVEFDGINYTRNGERVYPLYLTSDLDYTHKPKTDIKEGDNQWERGQSRPD